jgi:hypothetical protein
MYITTNIKKYEDLIVSYKIEGKSTELFSIERENLMETEEILYNELIDYIIKYLKSTKERITNTVCEMVAERYNVEAFYRFKI